MRGAGGLLVGAALALVMGLAGCGASTRPECEHECADGDRRCVLDGAGYQVCEDTDADGCFEWAKPASCPDGQTCADGTCSGGTGGLVLSGGLVPAAGVASAGGLRLTGVVTRDFDNQTSSSGGMSLEHGGFTSR
jgi:hypothetical protein